MGNRHARTIVWDEIRAEAGSYASGYAAVAELSHRGVVSMPVLIVNGAEDGPCLWLNGAVHGDELNGPMAMRRLLPSLDPRKLKGSIIATPVSNPFAFQARQKNTPQDGLDLDMQFPGDPRGTLSQRLAHVLFEQIRRWATHLIDFHTLGSHYDALPYTVFKRLPGASGEVCHQAETMARAFGGTAHCRVDLGGSLNELPGNVSGFLDVQCLKHGIPAFMAEIGSGGKIQPEMVAFGERGIMAVLQTLGMWHDEEAGGRLQAPGAQAPGPQRPGLQPYSEQRSDLPSGERPGGGLPGQAPAAAGQPGLTGAPTIIRRRFLYTDHGGLAVDVAPSGSYLNEGDLVCRIVDMLGVVQEIRADQPMYVIAARSNPPVDTGDRVAFVGTQWEMGD